MQPETETAPPPLPAQPSLKWYQGLDRYCWVVLAIATLGWLFDMMDQNLYTLIRVPSLRDILGQTIKDPAALAKAVVEKGGWITSIFLLGWAAGGFLFGILGDRLGRTRTMIITILTYSIFTGLNGFARSWETYALARFMTALGVGGEWAAGAALIAEVFPQRSRAMALGSLQSFSAVGNIMAALLSMGIGYWEFSWRYVYFLGALPAILIFWIFKSVKEPESWREAKAGAARGKELGSISELFTNRILRRNALAAVLLATAGIGGLWGVGYFSTDMLRGELTKGGWNAKNMSWAVSAMFIAQQVGGLIGMYLYAPFSLRYGRKPAFYLWFALAWVSILLFFWGLTGTEGGALTRGLVLAPILGFCTLGPLTGFTVYFPELFPTRLRATGCGFGYNSARIFAAVAPFALGKLNAQFERNGFAIAASIVAFIYVSGFVGAWLGPETNGKPLPEDRDFEDAPLEREAVAVAAGR